MEDWILWVLLLLFGVLVQVFTPRRPHPSHEHMLRMLDRLGETENGDDCTQR